MEQYVGTVEQFGGTVWLNSVVEQCGGTVRRNNEEQYGTVCKSMVEQWNSVEEQCGTVSWNRVIQKF